MQTNELKAIAADYELEIITWEKMGRNYKLLTDKGRVLLVLDDFDLIHVLEQTAALRPDWLPRPWLDCYGSYWSRCESGSAYLLLDWEETVSADWQNQEIRKRMTTLLAYWHKRMTWIGNKENNSCWKTPRKWWPDKGLPEAVNVYWQEMLTRNFPGIDDFRSNSWRVGAKRLYYANYNRICCCIPPLELARWLELNGWIQGWKEEVLLDIWHDYIGLRQPNQVEISFLQLALQVPRKIGLGFARQQHLANYEEQRQAALASLYKEMGR